MTEFRKKYQSFPVDFHLWSQDKIAELWWKEALAWVLDTFEKNIDKQTDEDKIDIYKMVADELEE